METKTRNHKLRSERSQSNQSVRWSPAIAQEPGRKWENVKMEESGASPNQNLKLETSNQNLGCNWAIARETV